MVGAWRGALCGEDWSPTGAPWSYSADGRLDGNYTRAELEAYLSDEEIDMWADAPELDLMVQQLLDSENSQHESFPYTGAPATLVVFASAGLVLTGLRLRRA